MKAEESAPEIVTPRKIKIKEEVKECEPQETLLSFDQDLPGSIPTTITSSTITPSAVKTSTVAINNSSISTKLPATTIDNTNSAVSLTSKELHSGDVKSKAVLSLVNQLQEDVSKEAGHNCEDTSASSSSINCLLKSKQSDNHQQKSSVGIDNGQMYSSSTTDNLSPKAVSIKVEDEDLPMTEGTNKTEENLIISEINNTCDSSQPNNSNSTGIKSITSIFAGHTKLKRLLGTLVQFANNISSEVGDTVRTLICGLLSGGLAIEEFHTSLQEATNFPLKDFVLPYLKHTLPLLRRNITAAARSNNQTSVQYLRCNESALLETISLVVPSGEIVQLFGDYNNSTSSNYGIRSSSLTNSSSNSFLQSSNSFSTVSLQDYSSSGAIKRRASDTLYHENGVEDSVIYGKRSVSSWNHSHHQYQQQQSPDSYCWYHPSIGNTIQNNSQTSGHGNSLIPPNLVQINQMSYSSYHGPQQQQQHHQQQQQQQQLNHMTSSVQNSSSLDDEWKNIHVMLNCILGMVEKTKRALVILQKRGSSSPAGASTVPSANASTVISTQNQNNGNNLNCLNGSQVEGGPGDRDSNLKRLSGEIVAQTIRATEDRVTAEVKRRAEEAVQEVKRAAMAEVQRAVAIAVAESRANERFRSHQPADGSFLPLKNHGSIRQGPFFRLNNHSINQSGEITSKINPAAAINSREDDKEMHLSSIGFTCWNCGRSALETCGGCGIARYCSSFCQHRDWESGGHHANCRHNSPSTSESRRSSPRSPPRVVNLNQNDIIGGSSDTGPNLSINITKAK